MRPLRPFGVGLFDCISYINITLLIKLFNKFASPDLVYDINVGEQYIFMDIFYG